VENTVQSTMPPASTDGGGGGGGDGGDGGDGWGGEGEDVFGGENFEDKSEDGFDSDGGDEDKNNESSASTTFADDTVDESTAWGGEGESTWDINPDESGWTEVLPGDISTEEKRDTAEQEKARKEHAENVEKAAAEAMAAATALAEEERKREKKDKEERRRIAEQKTVEEGRLALEQAAQEDALKKEKEEQARQKIEQARQKIEQQEQQEQKKKQEATDRAAAAKQTQDHGLQEEYSKWEITGKDRTGYTTFFNKLMKHEHVKTSKAVNFFHKSKVTENNLEKILILVGVELPGLCYCTFVCFIFCAFAWLFRYCVLYRIFTRFLFFSYINLYFLQSSKEAK
jgi:hypothetical protein